MDLTLKHQNELVAAFNVLVSELDKLGLQPSVEKVTTDVKSIKVKKSALNMTITLAHDRRNQGKINLNLNVVHENNDCLWHGSTWVIHEGNKYLCRHCDVKHDTFLDLLVNHLISGFIVYLKQELLPRQYLKVEWTEQHGVYSEPVSLPLEGDLVFKLWN